MQSRARNMKQLGLARAMTVGLGAWLVCTSVGAGCSRPILVPVTPTGFNVQTDGDRVFGVYPDFLREVGASIGCSFEFPVVPRARAHLMLFDLHQSDILLPASQTLERDQKAQFVHFLNLTPNLVTLKSMPDSVGNIRSLVKNTKWRAAMVRSYSWGNEYDALVRELDTEKRIDYVNDLETIGRILRLGRADFSILPASLLFSALQDGKSNVAYGEFRFTALEGLPRSMVGAYMSRDALTAADFELLRNATIKASRDGTLRRILERYYPPYVLRSDVVFN
jgi:polar amino acid transport system substrate-binding protein